jgi:nucleotide-binding universal stress UspA family protein
MMPFHKILFPVDFSAASVAMVHYVREMAQLCAAQVAVLHTFDVVRGYNLAGHLVPGAESEPLPIPYVPSVARLREQEEEHLRTFAREQFPDIECRVIMEDGDPAAVIDGVAQRDGTDLIMMPTRGLGTFRRLLLGSATAKVLHDVSCAVFTSVHEVNPTPARHAVLREIVCAIDLNEEAEAVLRTADFFAQACGARLSILHMTHTSTNELCTDVDDLALAALTRESGTLGVARVLHGDVAEGIRRTAIEESADLVIAGRGHERGTFSHLWSDLYEIVRESPCPVLSV